MTKEFRLGSIGVCRRGALIDNAHRPDDGITVVAGADVYDDALYTFSERYHGKVNTYKDYVKMLDTEKLDAVFITSPDFCHEEQAVAALERGIAVYLEKPMAITIEGCDRIMTTAKESGAKLFLGHNMRYMAFTRKMKELIDKGAIGEPKAVWCRHFIDYGGDAYFRDWHSEQRYTNSLLLQKGAHDIDIIHWLAGAYTERVTGFGTLSVYDKCERRDETERGRVEFNNDHWPPLEQKGFSPIIDVEDQNMILMQLENGVQAAYLQCHFTPDCCRNYTVIGTEGRIENFEDFGGNCTIELWNKRGGTSRHGNESIPVEAGAGGHGGGDSCIIDGFVEYLRGGHDPVSTPQASRYSVAVGCQGAKSIREGGHQEIPRLDPELETYVF